MQGKTKTTHNEILFTHSPTAKAVTNCRQHGLTLTELLIAIGIMSILMTLAVPSFDEFLNRRRLEGYAAEMVTNIQYTRSEAAARNKQLRISFGTDTGGSCYVIHTGGAGSCTCNINGTAQCNDANAATIKSIGLTADQGVNLQANVSSMLFDPVRGTVSPTGSINFTGSNGKTIRHVINIMGRTRTCSPNSAVNGYSAC